MLISPVLEQVHFCLLEKVFLGCFPGRKADSSPMEEGSQLDPGTGCPTYTSDPEPGLRRDTEDKSWVFPGSGSWQFFLEYTDPCNDESVRVMVVTMVLSVCAQCFSPGCMLESPWGFKT